MSRYSSAFWRFFEGFRRIVIFLLGCLVFLKGTFYEDYSVPELIVGMIMVGILPVENLMNWHLTRREARREGAGPGSDRSGGGP